MKERQINVKKDEILCRLLFVCVFLEQKSLSKVYKHKKDENTMDVFPCLLL